MARKAPADRWLPRSRKKRLQMAKNLRAAADGVAESFVWHDTAEGVKYWDTVHLRLLQMAMKAEGT